LLSLDDYTFNGKAFDTSGNNNTATITGAVKGTRDNAIEQMYQAFASRIGNLTE
jgi:ribosomal protein L20A (L18A)